MDEFFDRLVADPISVLGPRRAAAVCWRWATPFATLHIPDPLHRIRRWRFAGGEFLDGDPDNPHGQLTRYGLDGDGRIVFFRGWRANMGMQEGALWLSPEGQATRMAVFGPAGAKRPERLEATTYFYEQGRMVKSAKTAGTRSSNEWHIDYTTRWFRYDDTDRLVLVACVQDDSVATTLHPRAQRLTWSASGELALVTESYGRESVERVDGEGGQLSALLAWEERSGIERSVEYDARVDRTETQVPPEEEIYDGLELVMADVIEAAAATAVAEGRVRHPFLLRVFPSFPPVAELVDETGRARRRELAHADEVPELYFPDAVTLPVLEHATEKTLLRWRQARHSGGRSTVVSGPEDDASEAARHAEIARQFERDGRFRAALQFELNRRQFAGASSDFVALVTANGTNDSGLGLLAAQLGQERVDAFRASLIREHPIKLPRGPGKLRDLDDVGLLLRSRGVREQHIEAIAANAEWGARLTAGPGRSHLGGVPELPHDAGWPHSSEQPLKFIAQIEMHEIPNIPGRETLPADGRLLFFFAADDERFEPTAAGPDDRARVLYIPAGAKTPPARPPAAVAPYKRASLLPVARMTLPDPGAWTRELGMDYYDVEAYRAAIARAEKIKDENASRHSRHQILGHPVIVQKDTTQDPESRTYEFKLLLAIHEDSNIGLQLADAGALYYLISDKALRSRDWSSVYVDAQSA